MRWLLAACVLLVAAAPVPDRDAFIAAYVAQHREMVCGMHWVDNPVHAKCLAMLRREAEAAFDRQAAVQ